MICSAGSVGCLRMELMSLFWLSCSDFLSDFYWNQLPAFCLICLQPLSSEIRFDSPMSLKAVRRAIKVAVCLCMKWRTAETVFLILGGE